MEPKGQVTARQRERKMASVTEYIEQGRSFLNEALAELKKVHWPPRKETLAFTTVVLVVVAFVAVYLGTIDYLLSLLLGVIF
jgi:preprotein translocase subunit SecE